ncbi:hypothetical protein CKM354_000898200 [Cercospora kikuchii]|uniref:ADP-ribose 1''-phosphate phosphatase n=1 Tax=Cercospora kikuchii TaxID=84275 RepID=A0A9P3CNR6_9PEZI|nr:uncharacterized protein CKM354_000898200 [Cercospora kikuchii]GIZ45831.1 hypothetical protein CKM354_000898200 [Cercospora kikuchii]
MSRLAPFANVSSAREEFHRTLNFLQKEKQVCQCCGPSAARYDVETLDDWDALTILKASLCARPAHPPLPFEIQTAIDATLARDLATRAQVSAMDIVPILPRVMGADEASDEMIQKRPAISVWRGDITTLRDCTAIVNAANSKLLGCFVPGHQCIDNAIHAAAGPRLREACHALMQAQGHDEAEGLAKVTPGFNLNADFVIHTVGPQVKRNEAPSTKDILLLARCYESCLQAAEDLPVRTGERKVLAFCGISTGVFGFPTEEACAIAVRTVLNWFAGRRTSTITDIVFNVFSKDDEYLYRRRLVEILAREKHDGDVLGLHEKGMAPSLHLSKNIQTARSFLRGADYLVLSAGAGLSAATGLDYTSNELFTRHLPGFVKYGFSCLYDVFGFNSWSSDQARWSYLINHLILIWDWPQQELYSDLRDFVERRFASHNDADTRYFVRTSNADGLFIRHEFPGERVSTPQGHYAQVQCVRKCRRGAVFDSAPFVEAAEPRLDAKSQHLPEDFEVPKCPFCKSDLVLCVRGGSYFNDGPFLENERAYREFVGNALVSSESKVVILELGVGMNTPSVLRWHNENLVRKSKGQVRLIRIGYGAAGFAPLDLVEQGLSVGIHGDIRGCLKVVMDD